MDPPREGGDPSCVQYTIGQGETRHLENEKGSPNAIEAYDPGVKTIQNISLYTQNCLWMGQVCSL